tara:strand:+ start:3318 stop:9212 length:5895 start_codon:yes stop_codon:yes gene_type:complete
MPIYEIYKKDGTPVRVEGPEGATFNQLRDIALGTAPAPKPTLEEQQERLRYQASLAPRTTLGTIGSVGQGIASGLLGTFETGLIGAATVLPEERETKLRGGIKRLAETIRGAAPRLTSAPLQYEDKIPKKFGEALGSFGAVLGTALIPGVGLPGAIGLSVGLGAGEASERARAAGATPEQRTRAARYGVIPGFLEVLPAARLTNRIRKGLGDKAFEGMKGAGLRVLGQAGVEGLQEFASGVAQNLIEQGIYNPEKGTFTNTGEDLGLGAGVGGFVQAIVEVIAPGRARGGVDAPQVPPPEETGPVETTRAQEEQLLLPGPPRQLPGPVEDRPFTVTPEGVAERTDDLTRRSQFLRDQLGQEAANLTPNKLQMIKDIDEDIRLVAAKITETEKSMANASVADRVNATNEDVNKINVLRRQKAGILSGIPGSKEEKATIEDGPKLIKEKDRPKLIEDQTKLDVPIVTYDGIVILSDLDGKKVEFKKKIGAPLTKKKPEEIFAPLSNGVAFQSILRSNVDSGFGPFIPTLTENVDPVKEIAKTPSGKILAAGMGPEDIKRIAQDGSKERREYTKNILQNLGKEETQVKDDIQESEQDRQREVDERLKLTQPELSKRQFVDLKDDVIKPLTTQDFNKTADGVYKFIVGEAKELDVKLPANYLNNLNNSINILKNKRKKLGEKVNDTELQREARNLLDKNLERIRNIAFKDIDLLPSSQISSLANPLVPEVQGNLNEGNLFKALSNMSKTSNLSSDILKSLAYFSGEVEKNNTKVVVNPNMNPKVAGSFNKSTNTIEINPTTGFNNHVLLHEVIHSVVQNTVNNKSHPLRSQLNTLFNDVKNSLSTAYGSTSLDEFIAETFSNVSFQKELATINLKGEPVSVLQRFYNSIVNFLNNIIFKKPSKPLTALDSANSVLESLIVPTSKDVGAKTLLQNTRLSSLKNIFDPILRSKKIIEEDNSSSKPKFLADKFQFLTDNQVTELAKNFLLGLGDGATTAQLMKFQGLGDIGLRIDEAMRYARGSVEKTRNRYRTVEKDLLNLAKTIEKIDENGMKILNDIIYGDDFGATLYQVDPTKPRAEYLKEKDGTPVTDTSGNVKVEIWDKIHAYLDENTKSKNQKNLTLAMFNKMKNHYRDEYRRLLDVIKGQLIEQDLSTVSPEGRKTKKSLIEKILNDRELEVYFPLVRQGKFGIAYRIANPGQNIVKEDVNYTADPNIFIKVDSLASKRRILDELRERERKGEIEKDSIQDFGRDNELFQKVNFRESAPTSFVANLLTSIEQSENLNVQTKESLKRDVQDLYMNTLPETSLARQVRERKQIVGFERDALAAFRTKGLDLTLKTDQLKGNAQLRELQSELLNKIRKFKPEARRVGTVASVAKTAAPTATRLANDMLLRMDFAMNGAANKSFEKAVKSLNQSAFLFTLGFNVSSAMVNLSQIPLVVFPYFGARYGYSNTVREIGKASKLVSGSNMSISKYFDENNNLEPKYENLIRRRYKNYGEERIQEELDNIREYNTLVRVAADQGQLTNSYIFDALGLQEKRNLLDKITALSAFVFNYAERFNRQSILMASYKLNLQRYKDAKNMSASEFKKKYKLTPLPGVSINPQDIIKKYGDKPIEDVKEMIAKEAIVETQKVNAGTQLETGPRVAQQGVGRLAFMYKAFGLRMYTTLWTSVLKTIKADPDLTKEERIVAAKELAGVLGTSSIFAGIQGVPIYGAIQLFANLFLDDEEDDFDTLVRRHFGELAYKGPINHLTGLNLSDRIRLSELLIQENKFNTNQGLEDSLFRYLGGPSASVLKKGERAVTQFLDKEYLESLEALLPASLLGIFRSSNLVFGDGAYKTQRGDIIYDDVTATEAIGQLLGFPPAEYTRIQEMNLYRKRIDKAVSRRRTKLLKKYYLSFREGKYDEMQDALNDIRKFNTDYARFPDIIIDDDAIERSVKRHEETSAQMKKYNGVTITNKQLIDDLTLFSQ